MAVILMGKFQTKRGYTITKKGYKRITAGPDRHQYSHRVKARECMKESGRVLTLDLEVHHLCGNRQCEEDFHLLICPGVLHDHSTKTKDNFKNGFKRH